MKVSMICFTARGCCTALRIRRILENAGDEAGIWCKKKDYVPPEGILCLDKPLQAWTGEQFFRSDALIFVGATGITVRSIAPFLENKTRDPAVVTVDEQGKFVISLLSGHMGGANALCSRIADGLKAVPVITTATDLNRKFAVDVFAKKNGLWISDMKLAKRISAALLDGELVGFSSDFPVEGKLPRELIPLERSGGADAPSGFSGSTCGSAPLKKAVFPEGDCGGIRSGRNTVPEYSCKICIVGDWPPKGVEEEATLWLVPQRAVLGLGCRSGKSMEELEEFVQRLLKLQGISFRTLRKVCSIDRKAKEQGILDFCKKYDLPFETFSAEELMQVPGRFSASSFVAGQVGADNVCERSAVLGSGNGRLVLRKTAENGMTAAVAMENRRICFE